MMMQMISERGKMIDELTHTLLLLSLTTHGKNRPEPQPTAAAFTHTRTHTRTHKLYSLSSGIPLTEEKKDKTHSHIFCFMSNLTEICAAEITTSKQKHTCIYILEQVSKPWRSETVLITRYLSYAYDFNFSLQSW